MRRPSGIVVGIALTVIGVAVLVLTRFTTYAQMDRVDEAGTGGDLFALEVFWLGLLGFVIVVVGVSTLLVALRRRCTAAD